jgi:hypothetical protein
MVPKGACLHLLWHSDIKVALKKTIPVIACPLGQAFSFDERHAFPRDDRNGGRSRGSYHTLSVLEGTLADNEGIVYEYAE